jgi:hypothetical protein
MRRPPRDIPLKVTYTESENSFLIYGRERAGRAFGRWQEKSICRREAGVIATNWRERYERTAGKRLHLVLA